MGDQSDAEEHQPRGSTATAAAALHAQARADRAKADQDAVALMEAVEALAERTETLAAAVTLARTAVRRFVVQVALALIIIALIGGAILYYLHDQADRDSLAADQRARIIDLQQQIISLGQQNAAASAAAAACAQTLSGYVAIKGCVDRALATP